MVAPISDVERRQRRERTYKRIEAAAIAGERCPQADALDGGHRKNDVPVLARQGRIRIEVFANNWRVITILTGEHAGKKTAPPPFKNGVPYLMIDHTGTWRSGRRLIHKGGNPGHRQPSAPRPLRSDEL